MNETRRYLRETSMGKWFLLFLTGMLCLVLAGLLQTENTYAAQKSQPEVRGIWFSYNDYGALGLKDASKSAYAKKVRGFLKTAKADGCNTVYFHVRAFDDAAWKSKTFAASSYLSSKASRSKTAAKTYSYDPLAFFIQESQKQGVQVYAWLNPYRITLYQFLDPASKYSTDRINRAVKELQGYGLKGIVFDDYFYHSKGKYLKPTKKSRYGVSVRGTKVNSPSASKKLSYVNTMVRAVYKKAHKKKGWTFGISPQANVDNCMASGCDVKTWLSKDGYLDFVSPQIYWTDQYGSKGKVKMYSDRLAQWTKLNKKKKPMYVSLALYRTGIYSSTDRGWKKSHDNMVKQIKKMRKAGGKGYVLFTADSLYKRTSAKELKNLRKLLKSK